MSGMTREEAINWLKAIGATQKDNIHKSSLLQRKEAIHMAIEALENTGCSVCTRRNFYQQGYQDGLNADKWIPCSERLPDNNENVLVWCEGYFQPWIGWYSDIKRSWFVIDYDGECEKYKVIAWMPLPPAYKGE